MRRISRLRMEVPVCEGLYSVGHVHHQKGRQYTLDAERTETSEHTKPNATVPKQKKKARYLHDRTTHTIPVAWRSLRRTSVAARLVRMRGSILAGGMDVCLL